MLCRHNLQINYMGIEGGRSVYVHKTDGLRCEPDQEKTFDRVERMLPRLRRQLLGQRKSRQTSFGWPN